MAALNLANATSVENVIIKRGDDVILPSAKRLMPHRYRNAFNASATATDGRFTFPMRSFAADQAITIVIIGTGRNLEIELTPNLLRGLR